MKQRGIDPVARLFVIYGLFDGEQLRYVGRTSEPRSRRADHLRRWPHLRFEPLWNCCGIFRARVIERELIQRFRPTLNIVQPFRPIICKSLNLKGLDHYV
jgi:hypothetical protein